MIKADIAKEKEVDDITVNRPKIIPIIVIVNNISATEINILWEVMAAFTEYGKTG